MTVSIMGGIDRSVQQKETDGPNENVYMRRCYMQVQGAGGVVLWAKTSTRERREKEREIACKTLPSLLTLLSTAPSPVAWQ